MRAGYFLRIGIKLNQVHRQRRIKLVLEMTSRRAAKSIKSLFRSCGRSFIRRGLRLKALNCTGERWSAVVGVNDFAGFARLVSGEVQAGGADDGVCVGARRRTG